MSAERSAKKLAAARAARGWSAADSRRRPARRPSRSQLPLSLRPAASSALGRRRWGERDSAVCRGLA